MRGPVEIDDWNIAPQYQWFLGKTFNDIVSQNDPQFKKLLKHNVMKIVVNFVKLFHEKIDAWQYMKIQDEAFGPFLKGAIRLALSDSDEFSLSIGDRYQLLSFFNFTFNSIEVDFVHKQIKKYLPLSIWVNLSKKRRDLELSKLSKRIQLAWTKLEKQDAQMEPKVLEERMFERKFLFNYVNQFLRILRNVVVEDDNEEEDNPEASRATVINKDLATYCQRFIEFVIDIESQLPLRRFFHSILDHQHFIVRCRQSDLARHKSPEGHLFDQLIELLQLYFRYEIDIMTGDTLTDVEIMIRHETKILDLQKIMWSEFPHLKKFAVKPVKAIDNPSALYKIITSFDSKEELYGFISTLGLIDKESISDEDREDAPLMASILMEHYRRYESQLKKINSIPLFPNESVIWDTNLVPDQYYDYEYPLALPKLNLQFLTMNDYLLRNFMLFKNESTYEIRQDLEEGIVRSKCRWTSDGNFATGPKQRMALIIKDFSILDVGKPRLGDTCPSKVRAKVVINMDYVKPDWRREWEQLRKHDTCFLVSFKKPTEKDLFEWPENTFPARNGIKYVRGCEIEALLDSDGKVVDENLDKPNFKDNIRTFIVWMDCNQYEMDQKSYKTTKNNIYARFHMMVRRKPEKNNFKGVLETIRTIMNTKFVVPDWLRNLLIGFGDPYEAHFSNLVNVDEPFILDYNDTFLNYEHLAESFSMIRPDFNVMKCPELEAKNTSFEPPFKIKFDLLNKILTVLPYKIPPKGPYQTSAIKTNSIRFTPAQIDAITSGLQPGLTMVVGPPGTGKTDVAVQILACLYHSFPEQRTLIVTHSNQALNQIFNKIIDLDVQEHHLIRMGHGEEDLNSDKDFSRRGRVKYVLSKRIELLIKVRKLAKSLGLDPGQGFTCESAEYFHFYHILSRWTEYIESIRGTKDVAEIGDKFPFKDFFDDVSLPLFMGKTISEDFEIAKSCYRYIRNIFTQLQSFRPFEIFNNPSDKSQYLLIKEAKIVAMTCTHAGLRRKELVDLNFQYDNILMEETAQILEIETTIPLLLQNPENGVNRLRRWIMIGDHNQLPPIIQNSAFQKFSNMEQSLFARFVRLGFPTIQLDAQGRARASLCDLYRWRYKKLTELEHVNVQREFKLANSGFLYDYQLINVDDYNGIGESTPMPHYYQNRGEAEYAVALYRYMRLVGYPKEKITILTTYNGQKELIREIVERDCNQDAIGKPNKITTVDKFQGQQNDYIILSLVRTKSVGHIRDVRRLVVAMSRARLGLYVLARVKLFTKSLEIQPSIRHFLRRPQDLCLMSTEREFPTGRLLDQPVEHSSESVKVIRSFKELQDVIENFPQSVS